MTKTQLNTFIKYFQKSGYVTKIMPWVHESTDTFKSQVRYVGIRFDNSWSDIFSTDNNFLGKFIFTQSQCFFEMYVANNPPFYKFYRVKLDSTSKWENVLGELKRKLKKEKVEFQHNAASIDNSYSKFVKYLKK